MNPLNIDAETKLLGLMGSELSGSLSFNFHQHLILGQKKNWSYLPLQTADLQKSFLGLKTLPFIGFNVTYPFKEQIIPLLDNLDPVAERAGAVNTVMLKNGAWHGRNSDVEGFLKSSSHIDWIDRPILILGAGGASRAVLTALAHHNCGPIFVYNRTKERAWDLAKHFSIHPLGSLKEWIHPENAIVINATSLGKNSTTASPWKDTRPFHAGHDVIDLIYQHTPLLKKAEAAGAKILNGLSMLIHQAALSFSWWCQTPQEAPLFAATLHNHFYRE